MSEEIYVDSSVILALLFEETKSSQYRKLLQGNRRQVFSSSLLEAEVYAAAKREGVPLEVAAGFVDLVSLVFPEESLQRQYLKIFQQGYCRGADAYHLATALYLDHEGKNLVFVTADRIQAVVARAIGFKVIE